MKIKKINEIKINKKSQHVIFILKCKIACCNAAHRPHKPIVIIALVIHGERFVHTQAH